MFLTNLFVAFPMSSDKESHKMDYIKYPTLIVYYFNISIKFLVLIVNQEEKEMVNS